MSFIRFETRDKKTYLISDLYIHNANKYEMRSWKLHKATMPDTVVMANVMTQIKMQTSPPGGWCITDVNGDGSLHGNTQE